ncbi:MAG TPA: ribosome-associated translation inhibitor RaiA [Candidatus Binatia bacterium]|nr:ribosome-associated translation inhibitor RaiA [Candidatus Binatia bacterium]
MQISVTFRHVDPTPALRAYAEEKLERVKKYLRRPVDAHVILGVTKERHTAEITLQADHVTMFAKEETHDLYSAIDLAVDKLEHQAQKLKARRRDHKDQASVRSGELPTVTTTVLSVARGAPTVVRTQRLPARPMLVEEALDELAASREECVVFVNARSQTLAVLYRRKDGDYGLIEPEGFSGP